MISLFKFVFYVFALVCVSLGFLLIAQGDLVGVFVVLTVSFLSALTVWIE